MNKVEDGEIICNIYSNGFCLNKGFYKEMLKN